MRRSLIQNSITSEAKVSASYSSGGDGVRGGVCAPSPGNFFIYKDSVVRVSASYRPSSKVVGCGGAPTPGKKYFYIPVQ